MERAWMKTTHDLHDDETQPEKEKLFAFALLCLLHNLGLGWLPAAAARMLDMRHPTLSFFWAFYERASDTHDAKSGKGRHSSAFFGRFIACWALDCGIGD